MRIMITGVAGFIGMHVARRFLEHGFSVVGIDSLNDYYDVNLKRARLDEITRSSNFRFLHFDLSDRGQTENCFLQTRPNIVVHLAAQAGVRYSLENPQSYVDSNLLGFSNVLEGCRNNPVEHLIYASSSSVYGSNKELPFHEGQTLTIRFLYGATKG